MIAGTMSRPVGRRAHADVLRLARRTIGIGLAWRSIRANRRTARVAAPSGASTGEAGAGDGPVPPVVAARCTVPGAGPEPPPSPSCCGAGARSSGRSARASCPSTTRTRLPAGFRETGRRVVVARAYPGTMPRYDYRCRACGDTFEVSRPMRDSAAPTTCPRGHTDTVKLLSTVAVTGRGAGVPAAPSGGGCCGGACGC